MPYDRIALRVFEIANAAYTNAVVAFYEVDENNEKTDTLATLYAGVTGTETVPNPYTLDSNGKFESPVYFDVPVIGSIGESEVESHETGIIRPTAGGYEGDWEADTTYLPGNIVKDGAAGSNTGSIYVCTVEHESGVWTTDLGAGKWDLVIEVPDFTQLINQTTGAGTVDFLGEKGAFAQGSVRDGSTHATNPNIESYGYGSFVQGAVKTANTSQGKLESDGAGSRAGGYVNTSGTGNGYIASTSSGGSQVFGYVTAASGTAKITSNGSKGSSAFGAVLGAGGYIDAGNGYGQFAFGYALYGSIQSNNGFGTLAFGYAIDGYIQSVNASGALAFGCVFDGGVVSNGSTNAGLTFGHASDSTITGGPGGLTFGYAENTGDIGGDDGCLTFGKVNGGTIGQGIASGTALFGYAKAGGEISTSIVDGGMAFGYVTGTNSEINIAANGAMAFGYVEAGALVRTQGEGTLSFGYATGASSYVGSSGKGCIAFGYAEGGNYIKATGDGAIASGKTYSTFDILASGDGSGAFGLAGTGHIKATANNAWQFGPGTNAEEGSLSVGGGIRINGDGAQGTPRNGDVWVASNYVYIRSNGSTVKIT